MKSLSFKSTTESIKMRRKSPVTVQQWIDSLPVVNTQQTNNGGTQIFKAECSPINLGSPAKLGVRGFLMRDASIQSDDASNCSSVESVLELRRPDPEAVLLGLGFGPPKSTDILSRIPKRFLQQSKVNGIDIQKFLQDHEQLLSNDAPLSPHFTNCSQSRSSPVSPSRNCDNTVNQMTTKKNSF